MPLYLPGGGGSVEGITVTPGGDLQFNSGFGSVATAYGCRAWVNFNGTGTVAIRASGNVTSITDRGAGLYTVNFTNAMPDTNYSVAGICNDLTVGQMSHIYTQVTNVSDYQFATLYVNSLQGGGGVLDSSEIHLAFFR